MNLSNPKEIEEFCKYIEITAPTPKNFEAARAGDVAMQKMMLPHFEASDLKSSDVNWLATLAEENNWDAMRIIIAGATTLGFKSWKEACDINALKERLVKDCNKMDNSDIISICDDEELMMDKKCFFERARELKEAPQIYNYALYCTQGYPRMGIKQEISFALLLFKEAAALYKSTNRTDKQGMCRETLCHCAYLSQGNYRQGPEIRLAATYATSDRTSRKVSSLC